jgi:nucleotide-binding universal stress UspA family protein
MRVIDKAKEELADAEFEAMEGDARNVLCEAVDRHAADLLVVGSHGYGAIKRYCSLLYYSSQPLRARSILLRHTSST